MATLLLEPQDLTPAQAARVLDFLNSAASAAEIAAKVEFPGELDIGGGSASGCSMRAPRWAAATRTCPRSAPCP